MKSYDRLLRAVLDVNVLGAAAQLARQPGNCDGQQRNCTRHHGGLASRLARQFSSISSLMKAAVSVPSKSPEPV
jgi:hypothetical protein